MSTKKKTSVALFVVVAFLAGVFFTTAGANVFDLGAETAQTSRAAGTTKLSTAPADFQTAFTKVAESVNPTVVQVQAAKEAQQRRMNPLRRFFGSPRGQDDQQPLRQGIGSGVIVRSNGYIVMPAKMQSRIFEVDYLDIKRGGESNTRVSSGQVSDAGSTGGSDSGDDSGSSSGSDGASGTKEQNPGSRISTQSESAFWSGLERSVRSIIGASQDRSVVVDPEAGLVIVRAMPGELRDVQQYLKRAEARLQRQVVLEAKVLEVRLSESNQAGINWQGLLQADNGDQYAVGQSSVDSGSTNAGAVANPVANLLNPSATVGNPDFGSLFSLGANTSDFNALIQLLNTQGDVQVLSSPRVSTLNNQKAVIKVGSDEFFVTDVQSDQVTDDTGTAIQSIDFELTPFFSGIALDVTPQVGSNGEVTLHVHPSVSEVRDQQKSITVAGQQQSLPLAFSQVRESDSVVRASDGQVVVIGGLMQDESRKRRAQPGGLGDLPLIGGLFRQRADSSRRSELVILLRPIVADSDGDWSRQMKDFSQRLDRGSTNAEAASDTGQGGGQ
jgi:MSHA biogenesis protein MshL